VRDRWRIAVIDSGIADGELAGGPACGGSASGEARAGSARMNVIGARRFVDNGRTVSAEPAVSDPIGHGTAVTRAICSLSSTAVELVIGQVLDEEGVCTPAAAAAAICWALEMRVDLIHMSLGLREDRCVLADAVATAVRAGCVVIASAPARGGCTFPAAYAGVIRATGDARCAEGEISVLGTAQADFGGCPRYPGHPKSGGASIGAANVAAIVVARLAPATGIASVRAQLTAMGRYRGVEKKLA
jgi:subtilisin family serine protease